jgi:transcriptional regulator GlxA family with amidase domain
MPRRSRSEHRADLPPLDVSILVFPETAPMAVYGLYEILWSVGKTWSLVTGEEANTRRIAPRIVARQKEPYISIIGTPIWPQASIFEGFRSDVVIVTDVELPLPDCAPGRWRDEIAWIRRQLDSGGLVCSTCAGSVVLAEGGLLDGREAASHWSAAALFRDRYAKVSFRPERILCDSGYEGRLLTTGGASSWHDLALYLIGRFCGPTEAVRAAKIFLIGDRSHGQLPFAAMTRPRQHNDAVVADCQSWIAESYTESNPVSRMVARSALPERTFKRRFQRATGYSAVDYVQLLRIEEAKQLLEATSRSIDSIAAAVGYENAAFFRRLFKRLTGITPAHYRQRYQLMWQLNGKRG